MVSNKGTYKTYGTYGSYFFVWTTSDVRLRSLRRLGGGLADLIAEIRRQMFAAQDAQAEIAEPGDGNRDQADQRRIGRRVGGQDEANADEQHQQAEAEHHRWLGDVRYDQGADPGAS